jgi:hypothetical protein
MARVTFASSNTLLQHVNNLETLSSQIGDKASLATTVDSDIVGAINELKNYDSDKLSGFDSDVRNAISVLDSGGDGSLSYNPGTGLFTYVGPDSATGVSPISVSSGAISISDATVSAKGAASFATANFAVSSGAVTIKTGGVVAASIAANQVGAAALNVSGNGTAGYVLASDGDGSFSWIVASDSDQRIYANQYVGNTGGDYIRFGTDSAGDVHHYANNLEIIRVHDSAAGVHFRSDIVAYSASISDINLKENIETIQNGLDKVCSIRGVSFTRKDTGLPSAGVIAQELETVLPEAVKERTLPLQTGDEKTVYKTVEYDAIHGLLIEAIKELKEEIDDLKTQQILILDELKR